MEFIPTRNDSCLNNQNPGFVVRAVYVNKLNHSTNATYPELKLNVINRELRTFCARTEIRSPGRGLFSRAFVLVTVTSSSETKEKRLKMYAFVNSKTKSGSSRRKEEWPACSIFYCSSTYDISQRKQTLQIFLQESQTLFSLFVGSSSSLLLCLSCKDLVYAHALLNGKDN